METLILLGMFVLLAYTVEAMTGFGSIVIALSLGALLMPVAELVPILVPLNVLMTSWLCWRLRRHLDVELLRTRILPWMLAGTVVGYLALPVLREIWLKPLFGVLVIWFAAREWWRLRGGALHGASERRVRPFIFAAGITHGLFASGGPLLVYALAGTALDKARLRATLICVWLVLNSCLTLAFLMDGRLAVALPSVLWLAPLLPLGVWLGEHLHQRVDELRFRQLIYVLLLIVGALLVLNSARITLT